MTLTSSNIGVSVVFSENELRINASSNTFVETPLLLINFTPFNHFILEAAYGGSNYMSNNIICSNIHSGISKDNENIGAVNNSNTTDINTQIFYNTKYKVDEVISSNIDSSSTNVNGSNTCLTISSSNSIIFNSSNIQFNTFSLETYILNSLSNTQIQHHVNTSQNFLNYREFRTNMLVTEILQSPINDIRLKSDSAINLHVHGTTEKNEISSKIFFSNVSLLNSVYRQINENMKITISKKETSYTSPLEFNLYSLESLFFKNRFINEAEISYDLIFSLYSNLELVGDFFPIVSITNFSNLTNSENTFTLEEYNTFSIDVDNLNQPLEKNMNYSVGAVVKNNIHMNIVTSDVIIYNGSDASPFMLEDFFIGFSNDSTNTFYQNSIICLDHFGSTFGTPRLVYGLEIDYQIELWVQSTTFANDLTPTTSRLIVSVPGYNNTQSITNSNFNQPINLNDVFFINSNIYEFTINPSHVFNEVNSFYTNIDNVKTGNVTKTIYLPYIIKRDPPAITSDQFVFDQSYITPNTEPNLSNVFPPLVFNYETYGFKVTFIDPSINRDQPLPSHLKYRILISNKDTNAIYYNRAFILSDAIVVSDSLIQWSHWLREKANLFHATKNSNGNPYISGIVTHSNTWNESQCYDVNKEGIFFLQNHYLDLDGSIINLEPFDNGRFIINITANELGHVPFACSHIKYQLEVRAEFPRERIPDTGWNNFIWDSNQMDHIFTHTMRIPSNLETSEILRTGNSLNGICKRNDLDIRYHPDEWLLPPESQTVTKNVGESPQHVYPGAGWGDNWVDIFRYESNVPQFSNGKWIKTEFSNLAPKISDIRLYQSNTHTLEVTFFATRSNIFEDVGIFTNTEKLRVEENVSPGRDIGVPLKKPWDPLTYEQAGRGESNYVVRLPSSDNPPENTQMPMQNIHIRLLQPFNNNTNRYPTYLSDDRRYSMHNPIPNNTYAVYSTSNSYERYDQISENGPHNQYKDFNKDLPISGCNCIPPGMHYIEFSRRPLPDSIFTSNAGTVYVSDEWEIGDFYSNLVATNPQHDTRRGHPFEFTHWVVDYNNLQEENQRADDVYHTGDQEYNNIYPTMEQWNSGEFYSPEIRSNSSNIIDVPWEHTYYSACLTELLSVPVKSIKTSVIKFGTTNLNFIHTNGTNGVHGFLSSIKIDIPTDFVTYMDKSYSVQIFVHFGPNGDGYPLVNPKSVATHIFQGSNSPGRLVDAFIPFKKFSTPPSLRSNDQTYTYPTVVYPTHVTNEKRSHLMYEGYSGYIQFPHLRFSRMFEKDDGDSYVLDNLPFPDTIRHANYLTMLTVPPVSYLYDTATPRTIDLTYPPVIIPSLGDVETTYHRILPAINLGLDTSRSNYEFFYPEDVLESPFPTPTQFGISPVMFAPLTYNLYTYGFKVTFEVPIELLNTPVIYNIAIYSSNSQRPIQCHYNNNFHPLDAIAPTIQYNSNESGGDYNLEGFWYLSNSDFPFESGDYLSYNELGWENRESYNYLYHGGRYVLNLTADDLGHIPFVLSDGMYGMLYYVTIESRNPDENRDVWSSLTHYMRLGQYFDIDHNKSLITDSDPNPNFINQTINQQRIYTTFTYVTGWDIVKSNTPDQSINYMMESKWVPTEIDSIVPEILHVEARSSINNDGLDVVFRTKRVDPYKETREFHQILSSNLPNLTGWRNHYTGISESNASLSYPKMPWEHIYSSIGIKMYYQVGYSAIWTEYNYPDNILDEIITPIVQRKERYPFYKNNQEEIDVHLFIPLNVYRLLGKWSEHLLASRGQIYVDNIYDSQMYFELEIFTHFGVGTDIITDHRDSISDKHLDRLINSNNVNNLNHKCLISLKPSGFPVKIRPLLSLGPNYVYLDESFHAKKRPFKLISQYSEGSLQEVKIQQYHNFFNTINGTALDALTRFYKRTVRVSLFVDLSLLDKKTNQTYRFSCPFTERYVDSNVYTSMTPPTGYNFTSGCGLQLILDQLRIMDTHGTWVARPNPSNNLMSVVESNSEVVVTTAGLGFDRANREIYIEFTHNTSSSYTEDSSIGKCWLMDVRVNTLHMTQDLLELIPYSYWDIGFDPSSRVPRVNKYLIVADRELWMYNYEFVRPTPGQESSFPPIDSEKMSDFFTFQLTNININTGVYTQMRDIDELEITNEYINNFYTDQKVGVEGRFE
jgi:hypothetical protein